MDNLQSWVEQELRQCGVQDLATTMVIVESLVEYNKGYSFKPMPPSKDKHIKGEENKRSRSYSTAKEESNNTSIGKEDNDKDKRKEFMSRTNCFLCNDPS